MEIVENIAEVSHSLLDSQTEYIGTVQVAKSDL